MNENLDLIFQALGDGTRREILRMLLEDDMAVTDVAEPFEISSCDIKTFNYVISSRINKARTAR